MKKRIIATIMTLCMAVSIFTSSVIQVHAAEEKPPIISKSFDGFVTTQLYIRGMNAAGTILLMLGDVSGNETFDEMTTFVSQWIFGTSDSSDSFQAILDACNEILTSVNNVQKITENVESLQNADTIKGAAKAYDDAWEYQVDDVINSGNSKGSIQNVYNAYEDYFEYASGYKKIPSGKTIEDFEEDFTDALINLCSMNTSQQYNDSFGDRDEFYKNIMFTSDVVDSLFSAKIDSLLNNMEYDGKGNRYIDKAALYAYYAYPFSAEQAQFVDASLEQQMNQMTTLIMMYHDFLALRAQYYVEQNEKQVEGYKTVAECDKKYKEYSKLYSKTLEAFEEKVTEFFKNPICLNDGFINAETTLDQYLRDDSASTASNNNQKFRLKCNSNYNSKITQTPSFYKNASVSISNRKLVFTPFYVLNGDDLSRDVTNIGVFNHKSETTSGGGMIPVTTVTTYSLTNDYKCLKNGVYSDGNNQYSIVSNAEKLKTLINPTAYSAYKYTPYTYFGDYLKYGKSNSVYLLLGGNTPYSNGIYYKYYTLPFFNLKNENNLNLSWNDEKIDQKKIEGLKKKNERYAAILTPQSSTLKTTVNTQITGQGTVTVNGQTNCTLISGDTASLSIKAPQNYVITSVKALYHGDISNPTKVTSEKVLSKEIFDNELEMNFGVPYTNVTLAVETEESPQRITSKLTGAGSVDIKNTSEGEIETGDIIEINVNAPQNYIIKSVKALYYSDINDLSKVTSEKVLAKDVISNKLELSLLVPKANVTIEVETKEALSTDDQGNFVVSDIYNLAQMANMINSGYEKFVNGSYVLTNNIYFQNWQHLSIGTDEVSFNGTFNGNGYSINNMGSSSSLTSSERTPLFNVIGENAVIENLNFHSADISGTNATIASTGVICRQNNGTIRNCEIIKSTVSFGDEGCLGGVAGINNGVIKNCNVKDSTFKRSGNTGAMGGITEINNGVVKNCSSYNCSFVNGNPSQTAPIVAKGNAPQN